MLWIMAILIWQLGDALHLIPQKVNGLIADWVVKEALRNSQ
jgi:hypothetical protein